MFAKIWKTKGKMFTQLHKAWRKADHEWTMPFLTLSVFVERPSAHGAQRRIEHDITDIEQAERLIADLQAHVEAWRNGIHPSLRQPISTSETGIGRAADDSRR